LLWERQGDPKDSTRGSRKRAADAKNARISVREENDFFRAEITTGVASLILVRPLVSDVARQKKIFLTFGTALPTREKFFQVGEGRRLVVNPRANPKRRGG